MPSVEVRILIILILIVVLAMRTPESRAKIKGLFSKGPPPPPGKSFAGAGDSKAGTGTASVAVQPKAAVPKPTRDGLEQKPLDLGGEVVWYVEAGPKTAKEAIVLLHGFAVDKSCWTPLLRQLEDRHRVIALDLPGCGESDKRANAAYDVTSQTRRLRTFVQKLRLGTLDLVGGAMGGSIAVAYAVAAKEGVRSLTLIEPFGVHVPYPSDLDKAVAAGPNPLIVDDALGIDGLISYLYASPPAFSPEVKRQLAGSLIAQNAVQRKIWRDVREGDRANLLDLLLPEVKVPILVLQGSASRVVHPSTAPMIQTLAGARIVELEGCGHLVMVERPEETADHLRRFLAGLASPAPS